VVAKAAVNELAHLIVRSSFREAQKLCVGKCRREFSLPGMVNSETRASRRSSARRDHKSCGIFAHAAQG
jgi:hypothetical protein